MNEQDIKPLFHRRSIRLRGVDYSSAGSYFITLVTHQREHLFGEIVDGEMRLNEFGLIAGEEWLKTQEIRPNVEMLNDEFVIMPNHFHGIIHIIYPVEGTSGCSGRDLGSLYKVQSEIKSHDDGAGKGTARRALTTEVFGHPRQGSLATIIGAYKSAATKRINLIRGTPCAKVWLRNYFEHIITTEKEYENIVYYINLNPQNWGLKDEYFK